jgi:hypothetical protein
MTDKQDDNIKRAMKTNHRSSGDGAGMDRSVYVDDGSEDAHRSGGAGAAGKSAKGWVIAVLVVAVVVLVIAARSLGWLNGIGLSAGS